VRWGFLALNAGDTADSLSDAPRRRDWHDLPPTIPEAWGLRLAPVAADAAR
jgi:hypothetical protein